MSEVPAEKVVVHSNSNGIRIVHPKGAVQAATSSTTAPSSSHQDDVQTMTFATKANTGNRGRRNYIDYDPIQKKRKVEEETKTAKRLPPSSDGLDGGVLQFFAGI